MTEWQTNYNRRVNAERLARQALDVKKLATEILKELRSIEQSVYWAIDPDDKGADLWDNSSDRATRTRWSIWVTNTAPRSRPTRRRRKSPTRTTKTTIKPLDNPLDKSI